MGKSPGDPIFQHSSAVASFRTFTIASIIRASSTNLAELLKKKNVPRISGKTKSRNKKKKDAEIVYVYNLDAQLEAVNEDDSGTQSFRYELFRTRTSPFVHFRATCTSTLEPLVFRKGGIMSASILDNEGNIIQTEKFSMDIETSDRNLRYELEDFLSVSFLTEILGKNGELIILASFTYSRILPKNNGETTNDSSELDAKTNVKLLTDFKGFFLHDALNAQIGSRFLDDYFEDGSIRVVTKDSSAVVRIPIHRVLVAAQSPILESLLLKPNAEMVIEEFEEDEVRLFIEYLYSGEVFSADISLLKSLIKLGDKFQVETLREKCIRNILLILSRETKSHKQLAIDYFRLGKQVKTPQFMHQALDQYKKYKSKAGKKPKARNVKLKSANSSTVKLGDDSYEDSRVLLSLEKLNSYPAVSEETIKSSTTTSGQALIAVFTGTAISFLYKIPVDVLFNLLWDTPLETELDEHGEKTYLRGYITIVPNRDNSNTTGKQRPSGELQIFKRKGLHDVNLRIEEIDEDDTSSPGAKDDSGSDFTIALCRNGICDSSGRRIHEAYCAGYTQEETSSKICENISFIPAYEFDKFKILSGQTEVFLLTSIICRGGQIKDKTKVDPAVASQRKLQLSNSSLYQVVMEVFPSRIHAQLKKSAFSDAFIHMVDEEDRVIATFPVHKVLVSAFSELMKTAFKRYPQSELYVPVKFFSVEAMEAMLQYVYGLVVPKMTLELGLELLTVCQDFQMNPQFKEYIFISLVNHQNWTFEFALIFYQYGHFVRDYSLKDTAVEYFKKNKDEFKQIAEFQHFLKIFPELIELLKEEPIKKLEMETEASVKETATNLPIVGQEPEITNTRNTESSSLSIEERRRAVRERWAEYNRRRSEEHAKNLLVITPEMWRVINRIKNGTVSEPLPYSNNNIWTRDLRTLLYGTFLNDKVINEYFALINLKGDSPQHHPRVTAFPSVLYQSIMDNYEIKLKMDNGMFLLDYDCIFIPGKVDQNHWILFAVFPKDRVIRCYDSTLKDRFASMKLIRKFLESGAVVGSREDPDEEPWRIEMPRHIPVQSETCDCGVFICKYADYLLRRKRMLFKSSQINYFRDMMIWEIHQQKLNP